MTKKERETEREKERASVCERERERERERGMKRWRETCFYYFEHRANLGINIYIT